MMIYDDRCFISPSMLSVFRQLAPEVGLASTTYRIHFRTVPISGVWRLRKAAMAPSHGACSANRHQKQDLYGGFHGGFHKWGILGNLHMDLYGAKAQRILVPCLMPCFRKIWLRMSLCLPSVAAKDLQTQLR